MQKKFDFVIIGGGPGGYVAAIVAAQNKKSVALIEKGQMGGTCLNRGCIPTKTLIANADVYKKVKHAKNYGVEAENVSFNFAKMKQRKDEVVLNLRTSLEKLIKDNKIEIFQGHGSFISQNEIKVVGSQSHIIEADKIIIATGSEPRLIRSFPFDHEYIHDSTSILELTSLPKRLGIIGAGVIGCEFASLYNELGVEVTLIELLPNILSTESSEVAHVLAQSFKKKGIKILTGVSTEKIEKKEKSLLIHIKDMPAVEVDLALVAVGRQFNTHNISIENALVKVADNGTIATNEHMQTNIPHIYAIGDITGKWLLAHVASHQGIVAVNHALGLKAHMDYSAVPSVIFTSPEIASVGLSLEKAKEKGFDAVVGKYPFQALGKSQALLETDGFAQIVICKKTGQILGAQIVGYNAANLISEMVIAIQNELTVESVQETIHAHPTLPEAWLEAAFLATGTPLHYPPKRTANG